MNIQVQHVSAHASSASGRWCVLWDGKIVKTFTGDDARSDAQDYARSIADDARWCRIQSRLIAA